MAGFTPQTQTALANIAATAFASQPGVVAPNTDTGSALGPIFQSGALLATYIQNELQYIVSIERMANIPALPNNLPNPDLDSFCAPFGVIRLGGVASTGTVTCSTPTPVGSQVVVPALAIIANANGVTFQIQPNGAGYDPSTGGYDINTGFSSVNVPVLCLTPGILGNVLAGTAFTQTGNIPIPSVNSITNAAAFTDGVQTETDAALKARFTLTVSSGRVGTANAIIAAALSVQPGVIYSYGDRVNLDLSTHDAYFTLVVNLANSGAAAPGSLITEVEGALEGATGTFATGTLSISGSPTAGDTVTATLANGGFSVTTPAYVVQAGDTTSTVAANVGALINQSEAVVGNLAFIGAVSASANFIAISALQFGTAGNLISYFGTAVGGTTITPTMAADLAGGTIVNAGYQQTRPAGISYQVVGPTIVPVTGSGSIVPTNQFVGQQTAIQSAVLASYIAFVNGIGLNVDTTPTVCSIARCYAALLATQINGVNCIFDVTGLTLNGLSTDQVLAFSNQFVADPGSVFTATM